MEAWKAKRRRGLLAACACIVLAGWSAEAGRAADRPAGDNTSVGQTSVNGKRGVVVTTEGGQADRLLAGMLAFNPPQTPPPPPVIPPTTIPPDNPPPPDNPIAPVYPVDMAPDAPPPSIGPGTANPEPASLLMGLIGAAGACGAAWGRRRGARAVQ